MTLAQTLASALRVDKTSRRRGFTDGLQGFQWSGDKSEDMLSYSLGYADGITERACCVGCAPACKGEEES